MVVALSSSGRSIVALAVLLLGGCGKNSPPGSDALPVDAISEAAAGDTALPADGAPDSIAWDALPDSLDTSTWAAVPGGEACGLYASSGSKAGLPLRAWTACGTGCNESPAMLPIGPGAVSFAGSTAMTRDGEGYVRLLMNGRIMQVAHLISGETVAAVEQRNASSGCLHFGNSHDAAGVFAYGGTTLGGALGGRVNLTSGSVTWSKLLPKPPSASSSLFATDTLWGLSFGFSEGAVRIVVPESASSYTTVYTGSPVHRTASGRQLAVWSVWEGSRAVLKAYLGGSAPTIVSHDANAIAPAVTDDRLVWIGVRGPNSEAGQYTSAELYWSPLPTKPEEVVVSVGPTITATNGLARVQAHGDYAATIGECNFEGLECTLFVMRMSTKQTWRIRHRPKSGWGEILTVTPSEVVVGEYDDAKVAGLGTVMHRIVRLRLDAAAALSSAW